MGGGGGKSLICLMMKIGALKSIMLCKEALAMLVLCNEVLAKCFYGGVWGACPPGKLFF